MSPRLRLWLCVTVILVSSSYAVLVNKNVELAKAVALGYIAVVLTLLAVVKIGKT